MITLEQAKNLKYDDVLHSSINKNADGTCQRWRVNGKPQTWKTRPDHVRVPIKSGLRTTDQLTQAELGMVHLSNDCTNPKQGW